MKLNVCVAGITGWVGKPLAAAIINSPDMQLSGGVSRNGAGQPIASIVPEAPKELYISRSVQDALTEPTDVLVDYTSAAVVKENVISAIRSGVHVVVGSSGLTDEDYEEIDSLAREHRVGVIAAGNFAITAVLLQRFACQAAKYLSQWEIIDYGGAAKPDAPSGTARELSYRLAQVKRPVHSVPLSETVGERDARGATVNDTQTHSVRLPGFISSIEVLFGADGERLSIRHDSVNSAEPYIKGTLLAIQKVKENVGVIRGLDRIME